MSCLSTVRANGRHLIIGSGSRPCRTHRSRPSLPGFSRSPEEPRPRADASPNPPPLDRTDSRADIDPAAARGGAARCGRKSCASNACGRPRSLRRITRHPERRPKQCRDVRAASGLTTPFACSGSAGGRRRTRRMHQDQLAAPAILPVHGPVGAATCSTNPGTWRSLGDGAWPVRGRGSREPRRAETRGASVRPCGGPACGVGRGTQPPYCVRHNNPAR